MTTWTPPQSFNFALLRYRASQANSSELFLAFALGAFIGLAAWHWGRTPYIAIAFPILLPRLRGRLSVYVCAFAYHAATVYGLLGFASAWFNGSWLMGAMSWAMLSALAALVWPIFIAGQQSKSHLKSGFSAGLAMFAGLFPPFALVLDGHPLVAWGYLFEGWGFVGVGTAIVLTGVLAGVVHWSRNHVLYRHLVGLSLGLMAAAGAASPTPEFKAPTSVVGIDTYYGPPPADDSEQVLRYAAVNKTIRSATAPDATGYGAQVLVLPENTMNLDDPALDFMIEGDVIRPLKRAGKSAVIGKIGKDEQGGYLNQAVLLAPGKSPVTVNQRQPAMLSMWRPWHRDHFSLDWSRDTKIELGNGEVARVLICYEEYIPALFLIDEIRGGHTMAIVISSNWSAVGPQLPEVQRLHSLGMAKFFDRAVVRAVNYPREMKKPEVR